MEERDRNENGQFADRIPPGRILKVFAERDDHARPLTAQDIADACDIARRTAHNKLKLLEESGPLTTRKVGARGRVWWVPITEDDLTPDASDESDANYAWVYTQLLENTETNDD